MRKKDPITCCPHCGSAMGFYTLSNYMRVTCKMSLDGKEQDNSEMYDNAEIRGGNMAYCLECNKVICRVSTLQKRNGIL